MKNRRNYYRILHVQPDAPTAVIKASYRAIRQRLNAHPDLGGSHVDAVLLNEACATLVDPARRAAYDRARSHTADAQREGRRPAAHTRAREQPAPTPNRSAAAQTGGAVCGFCESSCAQAELETPDGVCRSCGSALFRVLKRQRGATTGVSSSASHETRR